MLGPLEGIIGVLMCGISVSGVFATVIRLVDREARFSNIKPGLDPSFDTAES
jgi:hypothetical protein